MRKVLFILSLAITVVSLTNVTEAVNPPLVKGKTYFLTTTWGEDVVYLGLNYRVREGNGPLEVERMMACVPKKDLFNNDALGSELVVVPWITGIHPDEGDIGQLKNIWLAEAGCFSCEGRKAYQSARFLNGKTTYVKVAKGTAWEKVYPRIVLPGSSAPGILLSWTRNHVYWTILWRHYSGFSYRVKENRTPADVELMVLCVGGNPTPWVSGVRLHTTDINTLRAIFGTGCFTCSGVPEFGLAIPTDGQDDPYKRIYRRKALVPKIAFPPKPTN